MSPTSSTSPTPMSQSPVIVVRPGEAGTSASAISRTPLGGSRRDASGDGPHTDHLAQLVRRQRRRQRLRSGLLALSTWRRPRRATREIAPEPLAAWLGDGHDRPLLSVPHQASSPDEPVVRWTPDRAGDWDGDWTGEWKWLSEDVRPDAQCDVSGRGRRW